jgi:hypothetical protein
MSERTARWILQAAFIILCTILVKEMLAIVAQTEPVRQTVDRISAWRRMMRDPQPGSPVSLSGLERLPVRHARRGPASPRAILLCVVSGCGT